MATRSPFPGMDPWLEQMWPSVHNSFIHYCTDQISDLLPRGLYAASEQTVYVIGTSQTFIPDSAVFEARQTAAVDVPPGEKEASAVAVAAAEPVLIRRPRLNVSHRQVAIRD